MKYCANCNKTFDDDVKFCPDCGAKLLSKDVCPKCGAQISENEKFCPQCGHKLERQRICPKCGEHLDDKAVFCPKCGEKFEDKGYVVEEKKNSPFNDEPAQKEVKKKEKKAKQGGDFFTAIKVLNIVFASLTFLVTVLILVGAFGGVFKSSVTNGNSETQNIGYFFGEGFKELSKMPSGGPKSLGTFTMVMETIFYFAGIIGCITLLVFSTIKNIKAIVYNRRADKKFFTMALLSLIPYLSFIAGNHFSSVVQKSAQTIETTVTFGWGTGILFAAVITGFAVLMVYSILDSIFERGPVVATAIHTPLTLMMIIMTVVVFGSFLGASAKIPAVNGEVSINTNSYYAANMAAEFKGQYDFTGLGTASYALGLIAMSFMFASVVFNVIFSMPIFSMSFLGGSMIMSIIGGALGGNFMKKYYEKVYSGYGSVEASGKLGGGVILMIIFTVLIVGGFITEMVLKKKQVIKA